MKRSKMLKNLEHELRFKMNNEDYEIPDKLFTITARHLLRFIEESGMVPPLIKIETTDIYGKPFYNFKNNWEDEE